MRGVFDPGASRDLDALRRKRLARLEWYPEPAGLPTVRIDVDDLVESATAWRKPLADNGAVKVVLDRQMSTGEFAAVGRMLGELIPETAPAVQPFVDAGVVLNLRTDLARTAEVDLQPFAENYITLHTEGSGRALPDQPRYLVFACRVAPTPDHGGQTLLMPMPALIARLPAWVVEVLLQTTLEGGANVPVCRRADGRYVLSFRDRGDEPVRWESAVADAPETVNAGLAALLRALYEAPELSGIRWEPSTLVILDNTLFLHGRSASPRHDGQPRHIQRLRVKVR